MVAVEVQGSKSTRELAKQLQTVTKQFERERGNKQSARIVGTE